MESVIVIGMGDERLELSPVGKLFVMSLVAWINNEEAKFNWKITGNADKVNAFVNAVIASKQFQKEIKKQGVTIEDIVDKLNNKNRLVKEFEQTFNTQWLL